MERTVATRTDKIAVSGRIDRLDARPELVVVDYKTGRHLLLTTDDARSSLARAVRAGRRACAAAARRRVELHHLPTGEIITWSHTEESLARHLSRAEDIAEECAAADEQMRDGLPARRDQAFRPAVLARARWHCPEGSELPHPAAPGMASPPTDPATPVRPAPTPPAASGIAGLPQPPPPTRLGSRR